MKKVTLGYQMVDKLVCSQSLHSHSNEKTIEKISVNLYSESEGVVSTCEVGCMKRAKFSSPILGNQDMTLKKLKNLKSGKVSIWLCVVDTKLSAQRHEKWSKMEVKQRQLHWTTFLVELFNSARLAFFFFIQFYFYFFIYFY